TEPERGDEAQQDGRLLLPVDDDRRAPAAEPACETEGARPELRVSDAAGGRDDGQSVGHGRRRDAREERGVHRWSEGLVKERRRPVGGSQMGEEECGNDREVVEREPQHPPPAFHAASWRRRAMSATSARGVDHISRSSSAGEIASPKASSKATISRTTPSES